MTIEATLKERGDRYGSFEHHAEIAQGLQDLMRVQAGWENLAPDQKQALTVIMDKVARMLNGDPAYRDNWHDIVGYAKLVDDRMARDETAARVALADASYDLGDGGWTTVMEGIAPTGGERFIEVLFYDADAVALLRPEQVTNWNFVAKWRYAQ